MCESANTHLALRLIAAFEAGDAGAIDELVHRCYRDHAAPHHPAGPDGVRRQLQQVCDAFTDRRIVPEDVIASGNRVVVRIRSSAVLEGRRIDVSHVHIWRAAEGQLAEHWMVAHPRPIVEPSPRGR